MGVKTMFAIVCWPCLRVRHENTFRYREGREVGAEYRTVLATNPAKPQSKEWGGDDFLDRVEVLSGSMEAHRFMAIVRRFGTQPVADVEWQAVSTLRPVVRTMPDRTPIVIVGFGDAGAEYVRERERQAARDLD